MRRLGQVELKVRRKVLTKSIRATLKSVVKPAVDAEVPQDSGALKRAIKIRAQKGRKRGSVALELRIGKEGNFRGKEFYGAFQEFGWKAGPRRFGNARVQVKGKHFLEQSFKKTKAAARDDVQERIRKGIDEVVQELSNS